MIKIVKIKLQRHDFDALNTALQQYIPNFVRSNNKDVEQLPKENREYLSRRVLISLVDDLFHELQRTAFRNNSGKISFKLSEAQAIAMFYLLQNIPLHPNDQFTLRVVNNVIAEIFQFIISPGAPIPVSKILSFQNTTE